MKKSLLVVAFVLAAVSYANTAAAQVYAPPKILMNWQADSYVPAAYAGKALPTAGSRIAIGVDMFNLGSRVDLSSQTIYWYVDDNLVEGGTGLTRISLTAPNIIGRSAFSVRVNFSKYPGSPAKTIEIPIVPPDVVFQTSGSSLAASAAPFTLQAYPYFFNVRTLSQLRFSWFLRGSPVGNQSQLLVTQEMAGGKPNAVVELQVSNPSRVVERLSRDLIIFPK